MQYYKYERPSRHLAASLTWVNSTLFSSFRTLSTYEGLRLPDREAAKEGRNTARERWRRAIFLALPLQDGNQMLADDGISNSDAARKYLETQHWLELIDG